MKKIKRQVRMIIVLPLFPPVCRGQKRASLFARVAKFGDTTRGRYIAMERRCRATTHFFPPAADLAAAARKILIVYRTWQRLTTGEVSGVEGFLS